MPLDRTLDVVPGDGVLQSIDRLVEGEGKECVIEATVRHGEEPPFVWLEDPVIVAIED